MGIVQVLLICLLSYAAGDISEKLRQGQGSAGPGPSSDFGGLLAPFQDNRPNVKGGRISGTKGGPPSGVKGGGFRQLGAGASNPAARVPIPFHNHEGDDDENNLDRLCNDAFHSFLCKPVGPRKYRLDGKLRPGAQIPPGILTGSSSNLQYSQQSPTQQQSGGALLPTELDNEAGNSPGYSYPKPQYNYDKPTNQLVYPSQTPSFVTTTTTPRPFITSTVPTTFIYTLPPSTPRPIVTFAPIGSPSNQISDSRPIFVNQVSYNYPKPSNPLPQPAASSVSSTGYSYPKPEYSYEKPVFQLPYPSQVAPAIQNPSNEYLPPVSTTPAPTTTFRPPPLPTRPSPPPTRPSSPPTRPSPPPTRPPPPPTRPPPQPTRLPPQIFTFTSPTTTPSPLSFSSFSSFDAQINQIPQQSNPQPVNQFFYDHFRPNLPLSLPAASQTIPLFQQPLSYIPPQTTLFTSPSHSFIPSSPIQPYNPFTFTPTTTISQPTFVYPKPQSSFPQLGQASNAIASIPTSNGDDGYFYPKPSNIIPVVQPTLPAPTTTPAPPPTLPPNKGYLPPIGAPVPKETVNVFSSVQLPVSQPKPFVTTFPPSTLRFPLFQSTTPRPLLTFPTVTPPNTFAPIRLSTRPPVTTQRPITFFTTRPPTTSRPFTFRPSAPPLVAVTTLRPFVQITESQTTPRPFLLPSTSFQPRPFNIAATNTQPISALLPQRPQNGYLPPPNQPIPSDTNEFSSILPTNQITFRPIPTTTTPRPTLPPPSKEYLPQLDRFGSSSNVSPNLSGGGLLAEEADAPSPSVLLPKGSTTERTHTREEFCRDAFHSFLCKPIDKPRRRIDGRLREGAKLPPNVLIGAGSAPQGVRRPNLSGSGLLPTLLDPNLNRFKPFNPAPSYYVPTNVNPQLSVAPASQPSFFLLSESDSSSLAKKFSNSNNLLTSQPQKIDLSNKHPSPEVTTAYPTTVIRVTDKKVVSTTARPQPSTTLRYTTSKALRASLVAAASADQPSTDLSPSLPNAKKNGYKYPTPSKPFTYPTTASGYNYPKPKKQFTFPATARPQTTSSTTRQAFGQRLRPKDQRNGQKQQFQQQEQEQVQFQEDPFGQNDIFQPNNELPPASQFEILKP